MATIVRQLKEAGVKVPPVIQRVWQWLKDNGRHTSTEIAAAINLPANNVSSVLGNLCDRGMVSRAKEHSIAKGHQTTYYAANPKMKSYELLPFTQEAKTRLKRGSPAPVAVERPRLPEPVVVVPAKPENLLDTLTVREAYAIYLELKAMFEQHGHAPAA